jgi:amidohydrolase
LRRNNNTEIVDDIFVARSCVTIAAVPRQLSSLRDELSARGDDLVALRRDLHAHPELGFAEHRTSALVAERLSRAGLEVTTGIANTGVVAVLRGDRPGRTIAWRADMDALPLTETIDLPFRSTDNHVMHACGHDGHTALSVIVAEAFAARRATLEGTAVFVFQPAEEIFGGARPMLEAGVLDTHAVEEIYGLHLTSRVPVGVIEACPGVSMAAADVLEIGVHGRGGHGASPELVINPIAIAAQILVGLSEVVGGSTSSLLSIGQIIGGTAFNIVPDLATMKGSLRTLAATDRREILERLAAYVERIASEHRARATVREVVCCPALVNHDVATEHVHACATAELGASHVERGGPVMASDDMSLFLAERPGCYFRVGAAPSNRPGPAHHSSDFEIDERGLAVGARVAASVLVNAMRGAL